MDLMKATYRTILKVMIVIPILAACTGNEVPEPEKRAISWQVESDTVVQSKALVNNNVLQTACTPNADGTNETIGIWGDFTVNSGGKDITIQEFVATPLTYVPSSSNWQYPGAVRYWMSLSIYNFRACYPQAKMTELMTVMSATQFQSGAINTLDLQEDLLVAAKQVDTRTANLSQPVRLDMQHIFAGIKFKIKAADGFKPATDEGLTSCWLQNKTGETNLFSPSGSMVHSGNASPVISWTTSESTEEPMYKWEHEGVSFANENTLYTSNDGKAGEMYTHNDAWVLVVPQTVQEGTLQFCYTLKKTGTRVFAVGIPAITYEHGKQYTYMLEIRGSEADVTLTIKDWNHLESNYDITL